MRNNKDHRVLALKEFQDKDYEDVLKRPAFCPKQGHKKEELNYFCKNCETAVCQICFMLEHGGHTLKLIEEEAERRKIEMKSLVETHRRSLQEKMNEVRQLDEDSAKLIQQGENAKRDVQRIVDNLIAVLEAKKQIIFSAVENQTMKSLGSVTKRKTEIDEQIKVIKSSLEKADKLLARSTNAEVVQLKKSLEKILEGVDQTESTADNDPTFLPVLVFVESQKLLDIVNTEEIGTLEILLQTKASQCIAEGKGLKEGTVGGEAQFVLKTRSAEGRQCYNKHDRVTVEIRDEREQECVTEVQVSDNKDGSYKISYSLKDQGRYKVTVKVNGEHVRDSPFSVQIKFFQVRPVSSFGQFGSSAGRFQHPWGVAVNERDETAVTDFNNHRVQIFNSDGNYLRSFGQEGKRNGEFKNPRGIAFHKNGNIFVVDSGNNRVQIFRGKGEYVGSFGGMGSLDSHLCDPCGLSVDSDGNIIVADAGNKLIKIFSPDGGFLWKFGGKDSFSDPVHCIQCDRYLVVSDTDKHCMKVFDRNGNFQYQIGMKGAGNGKFHIPSCLSVTKSGHLMICDRGNHRIQVFELNGKFVGKFGTEGRKLGEFSTPWSLAVLSNGRIVVTEFFNHRNQIFELL